METQQINSSDIPVYDKPQLPADATVILMTEETNYGPDGGKIQLAYQLPLDRIVPNNAVQKVSYSLQSVSAGINVPTQTVIPACFGFLNGLPHPPHHQVFLCVAVHGFHVRSS